MLNKRKMKNQNNQRIIKTDNGQLLIQKCLEDGELAVRYSAIFEHENVFIEPKVTMSFSKETDRDKAFNITDEAPALFDSLLKYVEDSIIE